MKLSVLAGSTSQTINIFIRDSSSVTGAGLTGLVYNTASLTAYYALPRAAATSITLATQTVTGAWSSGGFVEISSANMPGWYRFDIPDAVIASGRFSSIHFKGAANMAPCPVELELTAWNNQDNVRGGLAALPNANANANGGLPILSVSGTTLDYTISTITTYTGNTVQTGDAYARIGAAGVGLTAIVLGSNAISTSTFATGTTIPRVTLADTITTYTGNTVQTGDTFARIGVAGAGLTALGDTRIAHLDANISSISGSVTLAATQSFNNTGQTSAYPRITLVDTLTTYTGNTVQTGDAYARIGAAGVGLTAIVLGANAISTSTFATGTTIPRVTLADTLTIYTGNTVQTGDAYARIGAAGAGLTALGDTRIAHLDADISSITSGALSAAAVWAYSGGRTITGGTIGTYTGNTPQTGDAYARIGSGGASLTGIGDTRLANLDAAITSRSTFNYTTNLVKPDQSVALTDRTDATLGGALAGSWATAWGKVVKDVPGAHLDVWGPTNVTGTPSIIFTLDDGSNPTTRTPP